MTHGLVTNEPLQRGPAAGEPVAHGLAADESPNGWSTWRRAGDALSGGVQSVSWCRWVAAADESQTGGLAGREAVRRGVAGGEAVGHGVAGVEAGSGGR
ncbi:hypothetical protein [Kribbella steppae]|uniref:hypothetical protein n=1 Tax=Kribbella steppae TaxID=2512223 RepID=UPI0010463BA8|nr:hypothetical protein [Kribbella steppae]